MSAIHRRRVAWLAGALTLGLALSACSGDSGSGETGGGADSTGAGSEDLPTGQTLSVWTFGATGLEDSMEAWAEETGNTVEFKTSEFDPHHDQLLTALASGAVPDVAVVETSYSSAFKESAQFFTDLSQFGAGDLEDDYLDWRWSQGVGPDGRIFGLPTDIGGMAMAYRTDLFEAGGLPSEPAEVNELWSTWEEFIDVGEQYTEETGEPFLDDTGVLYQTLTNQTQDKYYDADGELIYDTNPAIKDAFYLSAQATDISAKLAGFTPEWNTAMAAGDYAVQLAPAWMLNYIQGQAPDTAGQWNIADLPEGGGNWGGSQLTIPEASGNAALAYDMISTVLTPENQLEVFKVGGNFPSTPELYTDPALTEYTSEFFSDAPIGKIYSDSALALEPVYDGPKERQIQREFGNALTRVANGEETVDEAWNSALDAIEREVN